MAGKMPFEKSKKDKEVPKRGKEGSKREEAFDRKQQFGKVPAFKKGGAVGKKGC